MKPLYFTSMVVVVLCSLSASVAQTPLGRAPPAQPTLQAQVLPVSPETVLQQQVWTLQQQVAALQSQLGAVLAAVQVTPSGVTLTGPSVTITGGTILVKAQNDMTLDGNANVKVKTNLGLDISSGSNASFRTGSNLTFTTSGATAFLASGTMNIKGSTIQLNGSTNPLATVGSQVQVNVGGQAGSGQIVTGSPTVFVN
jgi:hypothetical protein